MKIEKYLSIKKRLHFLIIQTIENEENGEDFLNFKNFVKKRKIAENKERINHLIQILICIANNHFRNPKFFTNLQKNGENSSYISKLIREDSIQEFIKFINERNIPLSATIKYSCFETHPSLYKQKSLIEYSAFFGSIQIFQYLRLNNVTLTPSLWIYAIHGRNPEMIHLLEEHKVLPEDETFLECFEEAIKCHHNEIASYIKNNLLRVNDDGLGYCFKYGNFEAFPEEYDFNMLFYYASIYDYSKLVSLLIEHKKLDINKMIIIACYLL